MTTYYVYVNPAGQKANRWRTEAVNIAICTTYDKAEAVAIAWMNWKIGRGNWIHPNRLQFVHKDCPPGYPVDVLISNGEH